MKEMTMEDIRQTQRVAAAKSGRAWWFGPGEMRFFSSRLEAGPFSHGSSYYFVTSECCEFSDGSVLPRLWSVRIWDQSRPDQVETWGRFQQFRSEEAATRVAQLLAKNGGVLHLKEVMS